MGSSFSFLISSRSLFSPQKSSTKQQVSTSPFPQQLLSLSWQPQLHCWAPDPGVQGSPGHFYLLKRSKPLCAHFLPSQAVPPSYPPELWVPSWTPPLSDHSGFHFLSVHMHTILFIPPATPEVLAFPLTWGFLPSFLPSLPIFCLSLFYPLQPCLTTLLRNAKSNHPRPQNPSVVH